MPTMAGERLDSVITLAEIAPATGTHAMKGKPPRSSHRRILWQNGLTVVSAAILIGAEVFGAAFAGGWAVASYLDLGPYGEHITQGLFFICGVAVMIAFLGNAHHADAFTTRG